jgi:hypothetical protein
VEQVGVIGGWSDPPERCAMDFADKLKEFRPKKKMRALPGYGTLQGLAA